MELLQICKILFMKCLFKKHAHFSDYLWKQIASIWKHICLFGGLNIVMYNCLKRNLIKNISTVPSRNVQNGNDKKRTFVFVISIIAAPIKDSITEGAWKLKSSRLSSIIKLCRCFQCSINMWCTFSHSVW